MYKKIVNPKTGRKVNLHGKIGRLILKNYLLQFGGASLVEFGLGDTLEQIVQGHRENNIIVYYQKDVNEDTGHVYVKCGDNIAKFKSINIVKDGLKTNSVTMDESYIELPEFEIKTTQTKYSLTALSRNIGLRIGITQGIKIKGKNCAK